MTKPVDAAALRSVSPETAAICAQIDLLQAFMDAISNPGEIGGGAHDQALAQQTGLIEQAILAPIQGGRRRRGQSSGSAQARHAGQLARC